MPHDAKLPFRFRVRSVARAEAGDQAPPAPRPRGPHDVVIPVTVELPLTPELQRLLDGGEIGPDAHRAIMGQVARGLGFGA